MIINSETGTLRRHRHKTHEIRAQHQPPQSTDSKGDNSSDRGDTAVTVRGTTCITLSTSERTS